MQTRTNQNHCPDCQEDRLTYGAGDAVGHTTEYPVECAACGWLGFELWRGGAFYCHTTAAGVACGYSLTKL